MPETAYAWTVEGEVTCGPLQKWVRQWEGCYYQSLTISTPVAVIPNPDPALAPTIEPSRLESEENPDPADGWRTGVWTTAQGDRAYYQINLDA